MISNLSNYSTVVPLATSFGQFRLQFLMVGAATTDKACTKTAILGGDADACRFAQVATCYHLCFSDRPSQAPLSELQTWLHDGNFNCKYLAPCNMSYGQSVE